MKRKPSGPKYHNLFARGAVIYYQRRVGGRHLKISTKTDDWNEAAAFRDLYEQRKGIGRLGAVAMQKLPTFSEFAQRYLDEDTGHLAHTTRGDRGGYLRSDGPLGYFATMKLDAITTVTLRQWWNSEILGRDLSTKTGRSYLGVLSTVLAYAVDLGLLDSTPVAAFREQIRRRTHTQRGRAESASGAHVHPIERPDEIARVVREAKAEGEVPFVLVLLCLDAGLRGAWAPLGRHHLGHRR